MKVTADFFLLLLILLDFRAIDKGRDIPEGFTQPFDSVVVRDSHQ